MEPIGILLFAVIMGMAALSIVAESIDRLVVGFSSPAPISRGPKSSHLWLYVGVYLINAGTKLATIFMCRCVAGRLSSGAAGGASLLTLAKEQSYDVLTYTFSFLSAGVGKIVGTFPHHHSHSHFSYCLAGVFPNLWFLDPITAILLSLYIGISWITDARGTIC